MKYKQLPSCGICRSPVKHPAQFVCFPLKDIFTFSYLASFHSSRPVSTTISTEEDTLPQPPWTSILNTGPQHYGVKDEDTLPGSHQVSFQHQVQEDTVLSSSLQSGTITGILDDVQGLNNCKVHGY